jgi:DNA-binding Lrp family transcriptional regulator
VAPQLKLDRIDLRILAQLQKRGRITNVELSNAVNLSPSPCLVRVKRLEQAGYITSYSAQLDLAKLGDTLTVFTEITLADHHFEDFSRFEKAIRQVDEIIECHLVSGGQPLPVPGREPARAQHRHREVLQLHRDQDPVREAAPARRAAVRPAPLSLPVSAPGYMHDAPCTEGRRHRRAHLRHAHPRAGESAPCHVKTHRMCCDGRGSRHRLRGHRF